MKIKSTHSNMLMLSTFRGWGLSWFFWQWRAFRLCALFWSTEITLQLVQVYLYDQPTSKAFICFYYPHDKSLLSCCSTTWVNTFWHDESTNVLQNIPHRTGLLERNCKENSAWPKNMPVAERTFHSNCSTVKWWEDSEAHRGIGLCDRYLFFPLLSPFWWYFKDFTLT